MLSKENTAQIDPLLSSINAISSVKSFSSKKTIKETTKSLYIKSVLHAILKLMHNTDEPVRI